MTDETLRKGDRVLASGAGRTAAWAKTPGTIIRRMGETKVEVRWDGTSYDDEMDVPEVWKLEENGE